MLIYLNNIAKNYEYIIKAVSTFFIIVTPIISLGVSIWYTNKQISEQKKQWKYDTIIKNEMQTLIDFREQYHSVIWDIHWFVHSFLAPYDDYPCFFHNGIEEAYRRDYFIKCWLHINKINDIFNNNLYIFGKYKLAAKIQFIRILLELRGILPEFGDFEIEYKDNTKQYRLQNFDNIKSNFAKEAHKLLIQTNIFADYKIENTENLLDSYAYIWSKVNEIFINLENDICTICAGFEATKLDEKQKVGYMTFYPYNMDIDKNV